MKTLRTPMAALLLFAGLVWLPACSEDDPIAPDTTTFEAVIDGGGVYETVEPSAQIALIGTPSEEQAEDGTILICTRERHTIVDAPLDYATFDPNAEVIFPGNLLQGKSLGGASPDPIVVERAPGTITINLVNGSEVVSADVDQVRYSTVIQAMNDIIAQNTGVLPAAFTYRMSEVQSREQLALRMGVNVSSLTTDVSARLSLSSDTSYNSFLVELNQRYYTMAYDMPTSREAIFHESVTPDDLAPYVAEDNPATYISSVTYGRRFYLLVESTDTVSEMQGSISASYDAALAGGSVHLEGRDVSSLSNVNVKVFALGGDHQLALASFNGDVDAIAAFLTEGGGIDTGVPLSYVVRNVKDNSDVAVKVATEYEVVNCIVQTIGTYENNFDGSPEGWTGYGDPSVFEIRYGSGIDGGYLFLQDRGTGYTSYFRAPLAYHGDWSQFHGGRMSFYLWVGGPGNYFARDDVVILDSSENRLAHRFSHAPYRTGFFQFYVDLDATENWLFNGQPATDADIQMVLSDVVDVFVRAEYFDGGGDWGAMDLFKVVRADGKQAMID